VRKLTMLVRAEVKSPRELKFRGGSESFERDRRKQAAERSRAAALRSGRFMRPNPLLRAAYSPRTLLAFDTISAPAAGTPILSA